MCIVMTFFASHDINCQQGRALVNLSGSRDYERRIEQMEQAMSLDQNHATLAGIRTSLTVAVH